MPGLYIHLDVARKAIDALDTLERSEVVVIGQALDRGALEAELERCRPAVGILPA